MDINVLDSARCCSTRRADPRPRPPRLAPPVPCRVETETRRRLLPPDASTHSGPGVGSWWDETLAGQLALWLPGSLASSRPVGWLVFRGDDTLGSGLEGGSAAVPPSLGAVQLLVTLAWTLLSWTGRVSK